MGLLNSALQIGRSALLSSQGALQVVGNNISSVGSPDYTRLTPQLDPIAGRLVGGDLQPGAGVALTGIQRNIDMALESRIRLAMGSEQSAMTMQTSLARAEAFFSDLNGTGVSSKLTNFLHTFDEVQNNPEDLATRDLAINAGAVLAQSLQDLRGQLVGLASDIDSQIGDIVVSADDIARRIANLNEQITTTEAGQRGQATALRDQRDALLRDLSELFDVIVREEPEGALNVYVGSEALVQGNLSRGLVAVEDLDGEFTRTTVRFADTTTQIDVRGGRLEGLIVSREGDIIDRIAQVDELAAAVIEDVNRVHADGQGLQGFDRTVGSTTLLATDVALNESAAGLPGHPQNGSFFITVADDTTGTPVAYRIDIDLDGIDPANDTTLESLVADINDNVTGLKASITADNRLALTADGGFSFTFGHDGQQARRDTSGVLAALGINTMFTGSSARDIAISDALLGKPAMLAAASSFLPGDGTNAARLAALDTDMSSRLGGTTINGFYQTIVNAAATASAAAMEKVESHRAISESLQMQKESISGVNLDEEAIALLKYERAFQGASRFISVVNDLLAQLVALIR